MTHIKLYLMYGFGLESKQGTTTHQDTWSRPIWETNMGLACVLMSRPISPNLVLSPDLSISNTPRYFYRDQTFTSFSWFFLTSHSYSEHPTVLSWYLFKFKLKRFEFLDIVHTFIYQCRFLCIKTDINFRHALYIQTVKANVVFVNACSLHGTY